MIHVDADDFLEGNDGAGVLERIKARNPAFRITLFTVPARCSLPWIERMLGIEWIRLVPHGWRHDTARECEAWSCETSLRYLDAMAGLGLARGFKAPGWQISDGMYRALLWRGWWVADQHYNDTRRPPALKVFYPGEHHYHVDDMKTGGTGNEIDKSADRLASMTGEEFGFIGD